MAPAQQPVASSTSAPLTDSHGRSAPSTKKVKHSVNTSGAAAGDSAAASTTSSAQDSNVDKHEVAKNELPGPLPPPTAAVQNAMAKAYMKQVGLDAWYEHFASQIPHTVKNIKAIRDTTQSDLETMAKEANMMLDEATIKQVLECLKIEPIEVIVNVPWMEWTNKQAKEHRQRNAGKTVAMSQHEKVAAQKVAKGAKKKKKMTGRSPRLIHPYLKSQRGG